MFRLRADRRHERDLEMQALKKKFAWGGTLPQNDISVDKTWPVDDDVISFVTEGYLRGWGLTAENVDLDVGTGLFPRRADVRRWNEGCIRQIERRFGDVCEGADVHGCNWHEGKEVPSDGAAHKRTARGLQTPLVLQLRTCPQHRMRVMVLRNQDVANGWANGTRARLLGRGSWTGKPRGLQPVPPGQGSRGVKWSAEQVHLTDPRYADFNVRVVKDQEATIASRVRFDATDVQCIPVRSDESSATRAAWRQVQATPAYGLTGHKSQSFR